MESNNNIIYGVSLGPGNPDLITKKGYECILDSDIVYYPGSIDNGIKKSYALDILRQLHIQIELNGFFIQMHRDRKQAKTIYENTFQDILKAYTSGKKITIVSEGDISLFSSFSYLLTKIKAKGLNIELIPGIHSFSLCASEHKIPICSQHENTVIIPCNGMSSSLELKEKVNVFDTIILMKISSAMDFISDFIEKNIGKYNIYYGEYLGTTKQYICTHWTDIQQKHIPYFSILILKKK